jgi:lipid-A-disaccharide synthase
MSGALRGTGRLRVGIVAGEHSGDHLGAGLMAELRARLGEGNVAFIGVGGEEMRAQGLASLFPISDIAVMGFSAVIARLPTILARIRETAAALVTARPDVLVIIDSPDFTHRVAKKVRARLPGLPIIDYVSPSVWAWRPARARAMRAYVDHVLALLPFEPEAHARLGGPDCTYVGHPLVEKLDAYTPDAREEARRRADPPILLVLPGSRRSEIARLLDVFRDAIEIAADLTPFTAVMPAVSHLAADLAARTAGWRVPVKLLQGEEAKLAAFRSARAALAASGTVTLELTVAGVPTVAAYRVGAIEAIIARRLIKVPSVLLPNLVVGRPVMPEFIQQACQADTLARALVPLIEDGPEREAQAFGLAEVRARLTAGGLRPSARAADVVLRLADAAARRA